MPKSNSTARKQKQQINNKPARRKPRKTRLIDEEEDLIAKQLACKKGSEQTQAALASLLIELSNATGVTILDEQIVRIFFQRAAQVAASTNDFRKRAGMFDVLEDISRLLGTTSSEKFSGETLAFINQHARFPEHGESSDVAVEQESDTNAGGCYSELFRAASPVVAEAEIARLRDRLTQLEYLPENEAARFQLESQIYKLENESEEWPDEIAA